MAVLALLATVGAPSASATTVLQVSIPEMTQTSQWVVQAHVLDVTSKDLRDQGQGLFTDVELLITEVYVGVAVPQTYTLRLIGGRGRDGMTLKIPGMPGFIVGEDVVVFLEATSMGHIPCGLGQGVWRMLETPSGTWVRQSMVGAHLMRRAARGGLVAADDVVHDVRPLHDLLDEVFGTLSGLAMGAQDASLKTYVKP